MYTTFEILDKISREIGFKDFQEARILADTETLRDILNNAARLLQEELDASQS